LDNVEQIKPDIYNLSDFVVKLLEFLAILVDVLLAIAYMVVESAKKASAPTG
jgi:hypothetical protein